MVPMSLTFFPAGTEDHRGSEVEQQRRKMARSASAEVLHGALRTSARLETKLLVLSLSSLLIPPWISLTGSCLQARSTHNQLSLLGIPCHRAGSTMPFWPQTIQPPNWRNQHCNRRAGRFRNHRLLSH